MTSSERSVPSSYSASTHASNGRSYISLPRPQYPVPQPPQHFRNASYGSYTSQVSYTPSFTTHRTHTSHASQASQTSFSSSSHQTPAAVLPPVSARPHTREKGVYKGLKKVWKRATSTFRSPVRGSVLWQDSYYLLPLAPPQLPGFPAFQLRIEIRDSIIMPLILYPACLRKKPPYALWYGNAVNL
ncbi:hypothetical protein BOTBODRAFT_176912 [Botryobasidium botryosum FD-172 SS1]|uniref:Uncharacterized protein n=1 Tax=Botryobasidium botryosum (strain FD-172 SS1) TaxID=930990 RepID=A0A067M8P5_BOTB1|nr:hypothetical protein BOTBODRAFT_176912 [Botryobasidium botryosum FD-172 SS1]